MDRDALRLKIKEEITRHLGDDAYWGLAEVATSRSESGTYFIGTPYSFTQCTGYALRVCQFLREAKPGAAVHGRHFGNERQIDRPWLGKICDGHDWVLWNDFLIDPWLAHVVHGQLLTPGGDLTPAEHANAPVCVLDLRIAEHLTKAIQWYGAQHTWEPVAPPAGAGPEGVLRWFFAEDIEQTEGKVLQPDYAELIRCCTQVLPDLKHYVATHGPGPNHRLAEFAPAVSRIHQCLIHLQKLESRSSFDLLEAAIHAAEAEAKRAEIGDVGDPGTARVCRSEQALLDRVALIISSGDMDKALSALAHIE
jgi:hypothetical protein